MQKFVCVILAAGKGKRMKSGLVKVLHPLCGKPMLFYVLELARKLKTHSTVLVIGRQKEKVMEEFKRWEISFVNQDKLLGTGDALQRTEGLLKDISADVIVLAGDTPLLKETTIDKMMELHTEYHSDVTLLSTFLEEPAGYGRIVRRGKKVVRIIEDKDATIAEKSINEINAGVYIFNKDKLFRYLKEIKPNNVQKEYYLTDVVRLIQKEKGEIQIVTTDDWLETIGINDRWTLSQVSNIIKERMMKELMKSGVTFICPEETYIDYGIEVGKDTVIDPFVTITGETAIGENCKIYSHTSIDNSIIGNNVEIKENCLISKAQIADNVIIPAYSAVGNEKK
ncbi:MAG: bifunctional N-acetylglucosamine-1-phosphate uridyltransferase/glucosamine-1-phosphate acetyltransferase [Candidatus Cloacimonadota bacterium]|nr:MAG: bifunctional N-acetylglucosamine-1-phosphate uridyltransferase/glucosamine-1-phosphate acetyltransferase [Candidatus Cloacimonadota bacterium]